MEKLRIGVIGTGSVVREIYQYLYFASDYSPMLSIEAAADPNAQALNEFCDKYAIPKERRFSDYKQMIRSVKLDAAQVNTPDSLHEAPAVFALEAGLDVLLPKPLADTIKSAHTIVQTARKTGRLLGVDFHKRDDPRMKEIAARYQSGQYGNFQVAVWYILNRLRNADPNFTPRFFSSPDYAEKNSPITFLTVHMVDAFTRIVNLKPVRVRARAYSQKLPTLRPIAVKGLDLVDTEVIYENGGTAHIISGWHLPNGAHASCLQSSRLICTDGMIDLNLENPGFNELAGEGNVVRNPLFRNFEADGKVTGYGMTRPGRIYQRFLEGRQGKLAQATAQQMMTPLELGFYATAVIEAAKRSLDQGTRSDNGVIHGTEIGLTELLKQELGAEAGQYL